MQNPDRCNGRGFLFCRAYQQYRAHRNCTGAPAAGTSSYRRDPYPVVVLYLQEARNLYRTPGRFRTEVIKQDRDVAADTAAGAKLCTKIKRGSVTKCPIFPLVTMRFSGSASPRRVGRGSSQYLLPSSPVATHFPALSATMPRGGGSNTARRRYAALVRCMRLAVVLCYNFVSNSAWLYPLTPLVIMPRKSSREKSESRNTSSGFIPSCLPIS